MEPHDESEDLTLRIKNVHPRSDDEEDGDGDGDEDGGGGWDQPSKRIRFSMNSADPGPEHDDDPEGMALNNVVDDGAGLRLVISRDQRGKVTGPITDITDPAPLPASLELGPRSRRTLASKEPSDHPAVPTIRTSTRGSRETKESKSEMRELREVRETKEEKATSASNRQNRANSRATAVQVKREKVPVVEEVGAVSEDEEEDEDEEDEDEEDEEEGDYAKKSSPRRTRTRAKAAPLPSIRSPSDRLKSLKVESDKGQPKRGSSRRSSSSSSRVLYKEVDTDDDEDIYGKEDEEEDNKDDDDDDEEEEVVKAEIVSASQGTRRSGRESAGRNKVLEREQEEDAKILSKRESRVRVPPPRAPSPPVRAARSIGAAANGNQRNLPAARTSSSSSSSSSSSAADSRPQIQYRLDSDVKAKLLLLLTTIESADKDNLFAESVTDEEAPGYSEIVLNPMDLGTAK
jgi:hypothetical protein